MKKELTASNILRHYEEVKNQLSDNRTLIERLLLIFREISYERLRDFEFKNLIKFLNSIDEDLRYEFLTHLHRTERKEYIEPILTAFKSDYERIVKMGINIEYQTNDSIKKETFSYSNYHLVSSSSIVHEVYEGEFKKCRTDKEETEIVSKPFKIKLIYGRGGEQGEKLLESQLLEGDFTDTEIKELIKSL